MHVYHHILIHHKQYDSQHFPGNRILWTGSSTYNRPVTMIQVLSPSGVPSLKAEDATTLQIAFYCNHFRQYLWLWGTRVGFSHVIRIRNQNMLFLLSLSVLVLLLLQPQVLLWIKLMFMITMAIMVLLIIMPKPFMGPVMHHRSHGIASPYPQQSGRCLETWWTSYLRLMPLAKQWEKYQSQSNNHCCFQAQTYWYSPGH